VQFCGAQKNDILERDDEQSIIGRLQRSMHVGFLVFFVVFVLSLEIKLAVHSAFKSATQSPVSIESNVRSAATQT